VGEGGGKGETFLQNDKLKEFDYLFNMTVVADDGVGEIFYYNAMSTQWDHEAYADRVLIVSSLSLSSTLFHSRLAPLPPQGFVMDLLTCRLKKQSTLMAK
jgi:hypothetical protein